MANGTLRATIERNASHWVTFASVMMVIAGVFQSIAGLVALFRPTLYVTTPERLLVFNYAGWGVVHLGLGILLILSVASLLAGGLWGRAVAITVAILSAIANFGFIWAFPFWSLTIIVLDIVIIYAVAVYGGERQT